MAGNNLVTINMTNVVGLLYETENSGNPQYLTQFSTPGTGANSTYAFGPLQVDVGAKGSTGPSFLLDNGFTQTQVDELETTSSASDLGTLNQELVAIPVATMAAYQEGLASSYLTQLNNVLETVAAVNPSGAASIENSPEDQLAIVDFINQYGPITLNSTTGMVAYLEGLVANPSGTEAVQLPDTTNITPADIANFVSTTTYSQNALAAYQNGTTATNLAEDRADRLDTAIDQYDAGTSVLPDGYDSPAQNAGMSSFQTTAFGLTGDITSTVDSSNNFILSGDNGFVSMLLSSNPSYDLTVGASNSTFNFAADANATVQGSDNTLQCGANDDLNNDGNNNSYYFNNGTINDSAGDTGNVFDGDQTTINAGANFAGTVDGTDNSVYLTANSNSSLTLGGTDQSVFSTGNLTMTSAGTFAVITGANTIDLDGTGQSLTLETQGDTVEAITGDTDETLIGSDFTLNDTTGVFTGTVTGGGNTFDLDTSSKSSLTLNNTSTDFDTVNATGDAVTLDGNTQANVVGSGNSIFQNSGGSLGVYGGGNDITSGADEQLDISETGNDFDTVTVSNDAGGKAVTDGEYSGIGLGADSQANIMGSGNDVGEASGDALGIYGGGNTIDTGAGELVVVGDTGDSFDTIDGSNDAGGVATSDGQLSGISFNADAQANVTGSGDTVNEQTGDSLGISGGDNTINAGADELVYVTDTGGSADTINASSDVGSGTVANGQDSGIVMTSDAQANITGSGDTVNEQTGDSLGISGGGNTINAGVDELVYVTDTGGSADTINASSDVDSGTVANGQDSGIYITSDAQAHLDGSDDSLNLGSSDIVDLSNGDDKDVIDGSDDTVSGSDDQISISGQGNTIDLSDGTIDVSGDDRIAIDGSDDTIVGGSGDDFTITGSDDDVSATDSTIDVDGSNTGDDVSGSGDTGTNWDDSGSGDPDPGSGYYGYGLTKFKGKNPSAAQVAAAEHSDSVYEGASWADKTITWSFASASSGFSDAITNAKEQAAVEQAFQAWAKASGLNFDEVAAGTSSDIEVGFSDLNTASTNEIGLTKYSSQGGVLTGAQVELEDPNQAPLTTNESGQLSYANTNAAFEQVALHEIGHALGLADTDIAGSIMNAVLGTSNQNLGANDVSNIQSLYGTTSASGGSSAATQSVNQAHQLVQAMSMFDAAETGIDDPIWDAGIPLYQELRTVASLHTSAHVA